MHLVPNMVTIVTRMSTSLPASRSTSALFGATRRAILALLFSHSSETYYLRQIARVTGLGLGGVQRELKNLTAAGILRRTVRGNQVCFQANDKNPVFPDLKSLITKTAGVGGVLHSALAPLASRIKVAIIFGSIARGDDRAESDVDLLIVGSTSFGEVTSALAPAQKSLAREINPAVFPPAEFRAKLKARQHFLTSVLQQPKIFVIGDELELGRLGSKRMARRTSNQP